jgi:hypothetical protein
MDDANILQMMGRFIVILPRLDAFVRRCMAVLENCVQQVFIVFGPNPPVEMTGVYLVVSIVTFRIAVNFDVRFIHSSARIPMHGGLIIDYEHGR